MTDAPAPPASLPTGCQVRSATARGLIVESPQPLAEGSVVEFDLMLGARPLNTLARVRESRGEGAVHLLDLEFLVMAQLDRDTLADFLQAVGRDVVRVREPKR